MTMGLRFRVLRVRRVGVQCMIQFQAWVRMQGRLYTMTLIPTQFLDGSGCLQLIGALASSNRKIFKIAAAFPQ